MQLSEASALAVIGFLFPGYIAAQVYTRIIPRREPRGLAFVLRTLFFSLPILAVLDGFHYMSVWSTQAGVLSLGWAAAFLEEPLAAWLPASCLAIFVGVLAGTFEQSALAKVIYRWLRIPWNPHTSVWIRYWEGFAIRTNYTYVRMQDGSTVVGSPEVYAPGMNEEPKEVLLIPAFRLDDELNLVDEKAFAMWIKESEIRCLWRPMVPGDPFYEDCKPQT